MSIRLPRRCSDAATADAGAHRTGRRRRVRLDGIGGKLFTSPKTADTYPRMEKLEMTHGSELVQVAVKAGLLKG